MTRILMPIPSVGFDPTEVSIPWKGLRAAGVAVQFITPDGQPGAPDAIMVSGKGLGLLKGSLMARADAIAALSELLASPEFASPKAYNAVDAADYDGIVLPGGHDKRIKPYLESKAVQALVVAFFAAEKPVAAICHGVVVAARSRDPKTGNSVLHGYKTTSLLRRQERLAFNLTRLWMGDYYLTYPDRTVEGEVTGALASPDDFVHGPTPLRRDDSNHLGREFTVRDRNYLSARWPGDVYAFTAALVEMLGADAA